MPFICTIWDSPCLEGRGQGRNLYLALELEHTTTLLKIPNFSEGKE